MAKKLFNFVLVSVILMIWVSTFFVVPAFVTRLMFTHSAWLAKFIVYFVILFALGKAVVDNKIHLKFYLWIKRRFGIRIY